MLNSSRLRGLTSRAFVLAGLVFVIYPAVRPFSDETTLQGAAAFASTAWIVAHSLAIVGFILIVLGLFGLYLLFQRTAAATLALIGLVVSWIGVGLLLPFYGAEAFGLYAIGQEALKESNPALVQSPARFAVSLAFGSSSSASCFLESERSSRLSPSGDQGFSPGGSGFRLGPASRSIFRRSRRLSHFELRTAS